MIATRHLTPAIATIIGRAALGAAVIVLAACGASQTSGSGTASHPAASPASHASASAAAMTGSIHFPAELLGLKENTGATAMQAISILRKQVVSRLMGHVTDEQAAIYGGGQNGATPFFLLIAGAWVKRVAVPDSAAHAIQKFLVTKGFANARLLPAGANGVAMVCGSKHVQTGTDTVCEWVDHVSFGSALYPPGFTSSLRDAASQTSQIRSAVVR